MDVAAAVELGKLIGAGLAAIGMIGAGIGVGQIWASYITAIARNPASKGEIGAFIWIGFAVTEAIALFALIMGFIILATTPPV
ncbi:MAG: F0F1 ATP synthase subunit C [Alphaproteobacteria bacterium]|nr:F0F1 ATP synthase subunit C [Alphaproteobacteria bacterium]